MRLPDAGIPISGPRCVPVIERRAAARCSSPITSSIVMTKSGNASIKSLQDGFDPLGARLLTGTGWQVEPVCSEHIIQQLEVMGSYSFVKRS